MATVKVYPISSNDSVQQFNAAVNPTKTGNVHFENFDEVTADDDTSYVQCATATHSYEFSKFSDPGVTGTITNVRFYFRLKHITATGYSRAIVGVGGAYGTTKTSTTSYQTFTQDFAVNPNTSSAWTFADIYGASSLWFGIEGWGSATKANNRLTQFYLEITYTAPPVGIKMNGAVVSKLNGATISKLNGIA